MPYNTMTSQKQTSLFTEEELTSSRVDSRAKTQVSQRATEKDNEDLKETEQDCGHTWLEPLKKHGQNSLLQKTYLIFSKPTMEEILKQSSTAWCEWGTMQNGEYAERQRSVQRITALEFTWLLTPTASDYKRINLSSPMWWSRHHRSAGTLPEQLHRLGYRGLMSQKFPLWMMGFPVDWTELPFQNGEMNQSKQQETQ
jgi:hypothetical protein